MQPRMRTDNWFMTYDGQVGFDKSIFAVNMRVFSHQRLMTGRIAVLGCTRQWDAVPWSQGSSGWAKYHPFEGHSDTPISKNIISNTTWKCCSSFKGIYIYYDYSYRMATRGSISHFFFLIHSAYGRSRDWFGTPWAWTRLAAWLNKLTEG